MRARFSAAFLGSPVSGFLGWAVQPARTAENMMRHDIAFMQGLPLPGAIFAASDPVPGPPTDHTRHRYRRRGSSGLSRPARLPSVRCERLRYDLAGNARSLNPGTD